MRPFLLLLAMSAPSIAEIPPKEYWPKKVTLSKSFKVEQKLPNGVAKKEWVLPSLERKMASLR
jgi:hypothetical protein